MRELLKRSGQEMPITKRTLEVNPGHPVITRVREMHAAGKDDPRLALYADLLYMGRRCSRRAECWLTPPGSAGGWPS